MLDPLSLAVGAAIAGAGWLVGRHARLQAKPDRPPKAICLCAHSFGSHDQKTGECLAMHMIEVNGKDKLHGCACQRYTGPVPADAIWPPIGAL